MGWSNNRWSAETDDEQLLEALDDEAWDDREIFGEEEPPPMYRREYTGRRGIVTRVPPIRSVGGLQGGTVSTPAGNAQVRFEKPLATKESVDNLAKELRNAISLNAAAIKKVDQTLDKNTSVVDKKINAVNKDLKNGLQQAQQMMLLPLLLTKPPKIQSIQIPASGATNIPPGTSIPSAIAGANIAVASNEYQKDDSFSLIFLLMAMSGGLGGGMFGSTSDSSSSMLLLALALSGGFK